LVAAEANDGPVVATLDALTVNVGLGLANSGLNTGVGNDSVNDATLTQTATGDGIVSNSGTASNSSDGTALINPEACEDDVETPPGTPPTKVDEPGGPSAGGPAALPRTGTDVEVQAAIALMLLLAGFGLRRFSIRAD
jgi:hypothetical protein